MSDQSHPSQNELTAFSLGQLSREKADQVEAHIRDCDQCCKTMATLSSDDTFVGLLKQADSHAQSQAAGSSSDSFARTLQAHARYQVEELIGQGGMGRVFKAKHRMMNRTVALKVIHDEWIQNPEVVDRFQREVTTAASLDHSNIVTAHDAEQIDDVHFLVMEYVDGTDLAQTVSDEGPLPPSVACNYVRQAAMGLEYAHQRGMVHRDIKPHNLMVTRDKTIKILDFGLASLTPQPANGDSIFDNTKSNLTLAGTIMGTPDFISPEQAQDARKVDGRSDIYSLGMTLYYLLAGRAPFPDGSAPEKLMLHAEGHPVPLHEIRDDIPIGLEDVLAKMTAKAPAERYQSPQEVVDALETFAKAPTQDSRKEKPLFLQLLQGCGLLLLAMLAAYSVPAALNTMYRKEVTPDIVAPLGNLKSYVPSMMESPYSLVFLNVGNIGENKNYFSLEPVEEGVQLRFPAMDTDVHSRRQVKYAERLKDIAQRYGLTPVEKSEIEDGSIEGVVFEFKILGESAEIAKKVVSLVSDTFQIDETSLVDFSYSNFPNPYTTLEGISPTEVTALEFVAEFKKGVCVYMGETRDQIFLIPKARWGEESPKMNEEIISTNISNLSNDFVNEIRHSQDNRRH